MKKIVVVILGLALVGGLIYVASTLKKTSKVTDTSLIAFAIEDTASVDKIEIFDSFRNEEYFVERDKDGKWVGPNGECVQQSIVEMMLETFKKVTLKGYVPKSAMTNMKKLLMAQYKRVKIYQNGKWVKTWFVGHATQDHMGTHMLLETPKIKSDNPVIMGIKGFYGIIEPRFFADPKKFECTDLFSYKRNEIQEGEVINRPSPHASFHVVVEGSGDFQLTSNGKTITRYNRDNLIYYLNGFENIHFNQPNYTLSQAEIDSMKASTPDYEINIKATTGTTQFNLFRRLDVDYDPSDTLAYDETYLWGFMNDGPMVRMQYYTVGPLLEGVLIFGQD